VEVTIQFDSWQACYSKSYQDHWGAASSSECPRKSPHPAFAELITVPTASSTASRFGQHQVSDAPPVAPRLPRLIGSALGTEPASTRELGHKRKAPNPASSLEHQSLAASVRERTPAPSVQAKTPQSLTKCHAEPQDPPRHPFCVIAGGQLPSSEPSTPCRRFHPYRSVPSPSYPMVLPLPRLVTSKEAADAIGASVKPVGISKPPSYLSTVPLMLPPLFSTSAPCYQQLPHRVQSSIESSVDPMRHQHPSPSHFSQPQRSRSEALGARHQGLTRKRGPSSGAEGKHYSTPRLSG
jgi:hypothetical protein